MISLKLQISLKLLQYEIRTNIIILSKVILIYSSPSLSTATSSTSSCSKNSDGAVSKRDNYDDKYLSTILRLDKEHNMFGLSSIAIIGSRPSKQKRTNKEDEKAVFHQTAIVQICCDKRCCNNMVRSVLIKIKSYFLYESIKLKCIWKCKQYTLKNYFKNIWLFVCFG